MALPVLNRPPILGPPSSLPSRPAFLPTPPLPNRRRAPQPQPEAAREVKFHHEVPEPPQILSYGVLNRYLRFSIPDSINSVHPGRSLPSRDLPLDSDDLKATLDHIKVSYILYKPDGVSFPVSPQPVARQSAADRLYRVIHDYDGHLLAEDIDADFYERHYASDLQNHGRAYADAEKSRAAQAYDDFHAPPLQPTRGYRMYVPVPEGGYKEVDVPDDEFWKSYGVTKVVHGLAYADAYEKAAKEAWVEKHARKEDTDAVSGISGSSKALGDFEEEARSASRESRPAVWEAEAQKAGENSRRGLLPIKLEDDGDVVVSVSTVHTSTPTTYTSTETSYTSTTTVWAPLTTLATNGGWKVVSTSVAVPTAATAEPNGFTTLLSTANNAKGMEANDGHPGLKDNEGRPSGPPKEVWIGAALGIAVVLSLLISGAILWANRREKRKKRAKRSAERARILGANRPSTLVVKDRTVFEMK